MKAAFITETGAPDVIQFADLPSPEPVGREVLVRVAAVSVNPIDTYIRGGLVGMELPSPFIVGCDVAGVVEAVGPDAKRFQVGDRVWGSNQGLLGRQGTFADLAAIDEEWLYPTPPTVDDRTAAADSLVGITAHLGLFRFARLESGETLFVNGGTGGVGSMVVQMAKAAGARVVTTVGGEEKAALAREFGADVVINYREDDVDAKIREAAPDGVNVWFETLREQDLERTVALMALGGRIVLMAGRDSKPPLPVGPFYTQNMSIHGFAMFRSPPDEQRVCAEAINAWHAEGKLRANIGRVLPLSDAAEAHRLQEANTLAGANTLCGKIVLEA